MLIRCYIGNFLSFADKIEFSMISAKNIPDDDQLIKNDYPKILKGSVLYGANASGKSNLIKAFEQARQMVVDSTKKGSNLPDRRFRLDNGYKNIPTHFEFEIFIEGQIYAYGFTFSPEKVHEEWLYLVGNSSEKLVFEIKHGKLQLNSNVIQNTNSRERLKLAFDDLLPNQLFLHVVNTRNTSNLKNSSAFQDVYNWFRHKLVVIFPRSRFWPLSEIDKDEDFKNLMRDMLSAFDTGISDISFEERQEKEAGLPTDLLNEIRAEDHKKSIFISDFDYNAYLIDKHRSDLRIRELCTTHDTKDGPILFRISEESDGTKRLTDLIPMFSAVNPANMTFVVDEINRSLHPDITYKLIDLFLHIQKANNSQLIATTHDTGLLDFELLRRDEIWFVEKDKRGRTSLFSLQEYKPRKDLNLQKAYLSGRFGGIPLLHENEEVFG
jgi:hypothetical protein